MFALARAVRPIAAEGWLALQRASGRQIHASTSRIDDGESLGWQQALQAGANDRHCFSSMVTAVRNYSLRTHAYPPVAVVNRMLRLCALHRDYDSMHNVVDILNGPGFSANAETYERLYECFTYFPDSFQVTPNNSEKPR